MSQSSLWVMDKEYNGFEIDEFQNSWLFSPIIWGVLSEKYILELIETPYGYKKNLILDNTLFNPLNDRINNCECQFDRVCWELSHQQVFFTKDKEIIAESILSFVKENSKYDKSSDGIYPLQTEHIIARFKEIVDIILQIDEEKYPYFIFKNTSVDDGVEYWFKQYDEETEDYIRKPLSSLDKVVTEFVIIENSEIIDFITNVAYLK